MQRILGQDQQGQWHIASSTYSTTMHTLCNKWMRVAAFAIEGNADPGLAPNSAPWCVACVFVSNIYTLRPR